MSINEVITSLCVAPDGSLELWSRPFYNPFNPLDPHSIDSFLVEQFIDNESYFIRVTHCPITCGREEIDCWGRK